MFTRWSKVQHYANMQAIFTADKIHHSLIAGLWLGKFVFLVCFQEYWMFLRQVEKASHVVSTWPPLNESFGCWFKLVLGGFWCRCGTPWWSPLDMGGWGVVSAFVFRKFSPNLSTRHELELLVDAVDRDWFSVRILQYMFNWWFWWSMLVRSNFHC